MIIVKVSELGWSDCEVRVIYKDKAYLLMTLMEYSSEPHEQGYIVREIESVWAWNGGDPMTVSHTLEDEIKQAAMKSKDFHDAVTSSYPDLTDKTSREFKEFFKHSD